jgi:hypothetical protein
VIAAQRIRRFWRLFCRAYKKTRASHRPCAGKIRLGTLVGSPAAAILWRCFTWTYSPGQCGGGIGYSTDTVADPLGNDAVYTTSGVLNSQIQYYSGSAGTGNLVKTTPAPDRTPDPVYWSVEKRNCRSRGFWCSGDRAA